IYLTFDDGPIPEITPWVLAHLKDYDAKASFFCIGDNVSKHPEIFKMLLQDGHTIGNHSHNHLNGWKTPGKTYVSNVMQAESVIREHTFKENFLAPPQPAKKYYRPPYGRITPSQI